MKIAYAIVELTAGSGQSVWLTSMLHWGEQRWSSLVVTRAVDSEKGGLPDGCPIVRSGYLSSILDRDVSNKLAEVDVVHVKSGWPFFIAALRSGTPTIYTLHGPDPTWLFSGARRINRYLARLAEQNLFIGHASAVVSVSDWVAEWYRENQGLDSLVIPDFIDLAVFRPKDSPYVAGSGPKLLCVGDWDGWCGRKRTHELVPLFVKLREVFPNSTLTLAGLSTGSLRELGEYSYNLVPRPWLNLVGRLSVGDLSRLYRDSDVYVTSTIVEGFYRPIVEAFASGLPAVVRDASRMVESVNLSSLHHLSRSGAGVAYDGSAVSFVAAVQAVVDNHAHFGKKGVDYSRAFDSNLILPRYEHLYNELRS